MKRAKVFVVVSFLVWGCTSIADGSKKLSASEILNKANLAMNYSGFGKANNVVVTILGDLPHKKHFREIRFKDKNGEPQRLLFQANHQRYLSTLAKSIWKNFGKMNNYETYPSLYNIIPQKSYESTQLRIMKILDQIHHDVEINFEKNDNKIIDSGVHHYLIKGVPKHEESDGYNSYRMWVLDDIFIPVEIEFYDKTGNLMLLVEVLSINNVQGHPTIMKMLVDDIKRRERVIINYSEVYYEKNAVSEHINKLSLNNPLTAVNF